MARQGPGCLVRMFGYADLQAAGGRLKRLSGAPGRVGELARQDRAVA